MDLMDSKTITIKAGGTDLLVRAPLPFKPLRKVMTAIDIITNSFNGGKLDDNALSAMEETLLMLLGPLNPAVTEEWIGDNLAPSDFIAIFDQIAMASGVSKKVTAALKDQTSISQTGPLSTENSSPQPDGPSSTSTTT